MKYKISIPHPQKWLPVPFKRTLKYQAGCYIYVWISCRISFNETLCNFALELNATCILRIMYSNYGQTVLLYLPSSEVYISEQGAVSSKSILFGRVMWCIKWHRYLPVIWVIKVYFSFHYLKGFAILWAYYQLYFFESGLWCKVEQPSLDRRQNLEQ